MAKGTGASGRKPNILIIWGDDIGWFNISAYNHGRHGVSHAEHRSRRERGRASSPTGTASRAAPPGAPHSSPASRRFAPA